MATPTQNRGAALDLATCWTQWTTVVDAAVNRRSAYLRSVEERYSEIHQRLLHSCDMIAPGECELSEGTLHEIRRLAEPWLTLRSLRDADFPVLSDVWKSCQRLDADVTHRRFFQSSSHRSNQLSPVLLFVFTFVFILIATGKSLVPESSLESLTSTLARIREFAARDGFAWTMGILTGVLTVGAAYIVFRAPRSY